MEPLRCCPWASRCLKWRDGRVAEGARLESVFTLTGNVGSNPTLSASFPGDGMAAWGIFRDKAQPPKKVTSGRFEIERDGEIAYLEYSVDGNVLELIHTEVPQKLRRLGL